MYTSTMRISITLHPFTNMVEVMTAMVGPLEYFALIAFWGVFFFLLFAGGFEYFVKPYARIEKVRDLLRCEKQEASEIADYIDSIGVEWHQLFSWVKTAHGSLMPLVMFGGKQDRLIATWQESRKAFLKLGLEKKFDPKWSDDDALGVVCAEIMKARQKEGKDIFNPY